MKLEKRKKRCEKGAVGIVPDPLVRSRKRVVEHGEVFTPDWMINDMLDLVKNETERIESTFLEPACGSGKFLVEILNRKLFVVQQKFAKSEFEKRQRAIRALMSIYGIELLGDNVTECRSSLLGALQSYLKAESGDAIIEAAVKIIEINIVHGDALTMETVEGEPITFSEWSYLGRGKFKRREFRFESMAKRASFNAEQTLFSEMGKHEIFTPVKEHSLMSIADIAQ